MGSQQRSASRYDTSLSSGLNANWETLRGYLVPMAGTQSVEIRLMPVLPKGEALSSIGTAWI